MIKEKSIQIDIFNGCLLNEFRMSWVHFKKETIKTNYKEPKFWEPLVIIGCNWCPYWYGMVFYYTTLNKKSKKKKES